jgi:hypothetical protein
MELGPAYWQQLARSIPTAKAPRPTCSPARRPCHPFERGRCANRAPRSVDLAKGNRSPEAQIPDHRRSGSPAARESAGRAAARAPVACVHGSCVDPAADRTLRPAGTAPVSGQTALSAQRRNLWNSSVLRHRRWGTAVGAGKDAPASAIALSKHLGDVCEPHPVHFPLHARRTRALILTGPNESSTWGALHTRKTERGTLRPRLRTELQPIQWARASASRPVRRLQPASALGRYEELFITARCSPPVAARESRESGRISNRLTHMLWSGRFAVPVVGVTVLRGSASLPLDALHPGER